MMKFTQNWENWLVTNLQICVCSIVQTLPVPIWRTAWRQAALPVRTERTQRHVSGVKANAHLTVTFTAQGKTKLVADHSLDCLLPSSPMGDLEKSSFVDCQGWRGPFIPTAPHEKVPSPQD